MATRAISRRKRLSWLRPRLRRMRPSAVSNRQLERWAAWAQVVGFPFVVLTFVRTVLG
ncbi:MAG TPA: hypothetical protein VGO48_14045 [Conexibacter sp.]|jgi:hypothetical protein|nr:hypothetical protein [Conexibacter sp.]